MEKRRAERGRRLVLVPAPYQGHMTPMLQLAKVLYSKGFSITIAHAKYNSPEASNHPDFTFYPLSDNLSYDEISKLGPTLVESLNRNCKMALQEHLAQMMQQRCESNDQVAAIIYDNIMYFAEAVANYVKLPSLVFRASNASYLFTYLAVPRLYEEGYLPLQDSQFKELVPELYPIRFKDLPLSPGSSLEDTIKWLTIASSTRTSLGIIWNTMDFLERATLLMLQQHFKVPVFPVGPLHITAAIQSTSFLKEDTSCIKWLDKQTPKSVLYASIGSAAAMDETELLETAWGLANSDQPFLWVVRPGSVRGSEWIELLPEGFTEKVGERGCIVKWAPQKEVLAHSAIGGFWSHCGWNSSLESISQGVPMICRPYFVDQKVNARYLTYVWKVGLELEHVLKRDEIANTIRRILVDKEGEQVRERAIEMKRKIKDSVKEGGSWYKTLNELADFICSLNIKN